MDSRITAFLKGYTEGFQIEANLADLFFPEIIIQPTKDFELDDFSHSRKAARFTPGQAHEAIINPIRNTRYRPMPVKEKASLDDLSMFTAQTGDNPYTGANLGAINMTMKDLDLRIIRRFEVIASQVLTLGQMVDQNGTILTPFNRDAALSVTADWASENPLDTIRDLYRLLQQKGMPMSRVVLLFGATAFRKFVDHAAVQAVMDNRTFGGQNFAGLTIENGTSKVANAGTYHLHGVVDQPVQFLTYSESYSDTSDTIQNIVNENSVIVTSLNAPRYQYYGGIPVVNADKSVTVVPGRRVFYNDVSVDPAALFIYVESRPLFVPGNVNHIGHITVA